ncbi:MFS-type transporter SLC18B1 [Nymphon striatum]|nr:MFS-type transporter SLC18B1 [Nymphon striatum]
MYNQHIEPGAPKFLVDALDTVLLQAFTKNMTPADVGVIFAAFPASTLVVSLFGATLVNRLGTRFLFIISCCLAVCTNIPFAFVMCANSGLSFYIWSLIFRILQGVSYVGIQISSFSIITNEMEQYLSTLMGMIEMSFGIGGSIGAIIGGSLFDKFGFKAPFFTFSILLGLLTITAYFGINPEPFKTNVHEEVTGKKSPASILIRIPEIIFPFWAGAAGTVASSFIEVSLSPRLTDYFKTTTTVAGCYLMIYGTVSTILSPIFGYILDKKGYHEHVLIIGCFIMGIGQLLLGPVPILGIIPSLPLACLSIVIAGVCIPMLAVPVIAASFNITKELVGPLLGGVLINELKFERATGYISLISFLGVTAIREWILALLANAHFSKQNADEEKEKNIPPRTVKEQPFCYYALALGVRIYAEI